jgi:hypothetical protein
MSFQDSNVATESPRPDEPDDVFYWRMKQLLGAGYSCKTAEMLAAQLGVDLHLACSLLEAGCSETTAVRIVS